MKDYLALTKPRITWLILMSTAVGYFFGSRAGWHWADILNTFLGTALIASGTAALNQWYERDADAHMRRTQRRPLPAGRIDPRRAFAFALAITIAGLIELWWGVNPLTSLLGLFTVLCYILIYTPLKRVSPHSTTVGAVAGAMPPLIGYAAASGRLDAQAAVLFAILFLWQFPHFHAIGWMYREDYERAGMRMLAVVQPDGKALARSVLLFSLILVPVSLIPKYLSMTGNLYPLGALAIGALFLYTGFRMRSDLTRQRARGVLLASVVYLPLLYGLMLLDRPA